MTISEEMTEILTARAAMGATLLDGMEPGWYTKIDLSELDLSRPDFCIIGQIFGDYWTWLDSVNWTASVASYFGFYIENEVMENDDPEYSSDTYYDALADIWTAEISRRLETHQKVPAGV